METETNFMEELKEYFDKTPKEQIEKDWEATEVWDEVKEEEKNYSSKSHRFTRYGEEYDRF